MKQAKSEKSNKSGTKSGAVTVVKLSLSGKPKPGKIFYKIGEVSRITGLESYVLRFWESEFPILHPKKNSGGQRVYHPEDISLILEIKKMLYDEGLTIEGARKKLKKKNNRTPALNTDLHRIQSELKDLLELLH